MIVLTAVGYYPFAVAGSVLDEATFDALTTGTPRAELVDRRAAKGRQADPADKRRLQRAELIPEEEHQLA